MSDPGLFGPGSMTWRIHREAAVLAGGQAALLMQVAHPLVAAAVAEHSGFPADAWRRLRRTLESGLAVVFGTTEEARAAAERVNARHAQVQGALRERVGAFPAGTPYGATDPELLLWVHATLVGTALGAYETFAGALTEDERARYYEETHVSARLFGVGDAPADLIAFRRYVEAMLPVLAVGDDARRLARAIMRPLPRWIPSPVYLPAVVVTAGLLPPQVRDAYGIRFGRARRLAFATAARAGRLALPRLPRALRDVPQARAAIARLKGRNPTNEH